MFRRLFALLLAAACCPLAGCLSVHATRPVDVVVTHADTGEPAAGVRVEAVYGFYMGMIRPLNKPGPADGTTDADGRVTLPLWDQSNTGLKAGDDCWWEVPGEAVRHGGHLDHLLRPSRDDDPQPKYHVRLVARRRWLAQHLLMPPGDWHGARTDP